MRELVGGEKLEEVSKGKLVGEILTMGQRCGLLQNYCCEVCWPRVFDRETLGIVKRSLLHWCGLTSKFLQQLAIAAG